MNILFIAQVAVPMALILWMALSPPRSASGFGIQFAASAACLWAATLLGIWLVPPWWAPWAFGAGLLAAAGLALHRRRPVASTMPASPGSWAVAVVFAWLAHRTAGSVVAALVFHTAINFWPSVVPVLPTEASYRAYAFVVATLVVMAVVALLTSGPIAGRATSGGPGLADAKP